MKLKHTVLLVLPSPACWAAPWRAPTNSSSACRATGSAPTPPAAPGCSAAGSTTCSSSTERDGGVNGVKLTWEECETEYNNARGVECYERLKKKGSTGNSVFQPVSTGITYSVLDKVAQDKIPMVTIGYGRTDAADGRVFPWVFPMITTYWSQASAIRNYMGQKEGGMDKLKGKKIGLLYHDSAYGKESTPSWTSWRPSTASR
jgi:hypothetical protein